MILPGPIRGACRRVHDEEEGVSLVEALVAVVILATALLALVATAATTTTSLRLSRDRQQAVQTASAALEEVRNMDWDDLVLDVTPPPPSDVAFEGEPIVDGGGPLPHLVVDGRFTTTTYVTWADDPLNTLKRVTAITSWEDRGATREVRESTLVAIAERGLPVPNFRVSPDTSAQQKLEGSPVCFEYAVVNLGEKDSYSYQAGQLDSSGNFVAGTWNLSFTVDGDAHEGFKVNEISGGPWFVWATLGHPDPVSGKSAEMKDVTGDQRPDSQDPVERRDSVPVEFCAVHHSGSGHGSPTFVFRIFSAFDDNVLRDATGTVTSTVPTEKLYLVTGGSKQRTKYALSPSKPIRTDTTFNFDSGAESNPGLRLAPGSTSGRVNWDYQMTASRIEGTATLTLFLSNDELLSGTTDGLDESIGLQLRVEKLNSQRNTVAVIADQALDIPETTARTAAVSGWYRHAVSFALPTTTFAANEYLRVSLWDRTATDDDGATHVHFDVNENGTADDPTSYGGTGSGTNERFMSNLDIRVVPQ